MATQLNRNELEGKGCLITGASRTLGAEIARQMAALGVNVGLNYFKSGNWKRLKAW